MSAAVRQGNAVLIAGLAWVAALTLGGRLAAQSPAGFNSPPETRTYDLGPFARRFPGEESPGRSVVEWIVRETGAEAWHGAIPAVLSANGATLTVHHTPAMHELIDEIVRRFTAETGDASFKLRLTTFAHPDWRARIHALATPIPVATPGAQAWLMTREGAAAAMHDLQRRADFREQTSSELAVPNGRPTTVAALRPRDYVQDITVGRSITAPFTTRQARVEEGFRLDLQPLYSLDRRQVDLSLKLELRQIEKLAVVVLDASASGSPQRARVESPQIVERVVEERLRWPVDQVLVVAAGSGPTATPNPDLRNRFGLPIPAAAARVEFVVWIEPQSLAAAAPVATSPAAAARPGLTPLAR